MRINISDIRRHKGDYIPFSFRIAEPENEEDVLQFAPEQPLVVEGTIANTGNGYVVSGHIQGVVTLQCARCLQPYNWSFSVPLAERFCTENDWQYWSERLESEAEEAEDDVDDIHLFSGDMIDLTQAVYEQIIVSLPMRGVCDDNCQGLCDQCGINLNEATCECTKDDVDIRLAPLAALLATEEDEHRN